MRAVDQEGKQIDKSSPSGAQSTKRVDDLYRYRFSPLSGRGNGKVWAEDAKANIGFLRGKLDIIKARECTRELEPARKDHAINSGASAPSGVSTKNELTRRISHEEVAATCRAVETLLHKAEDAALGNSPRFYWFVSWWSGTGVEAAYKNLHYAEALIARLYNCEEVRCAVPDALRRAIAALDYSHPTRAIAISMLHSTEDSQNFCSTHQLSEIIAVGHETADRSRARLHSFRNILLIGTVINVLLMIAFILVVAKNPNLVPLCFHPSGKQNPVICPTRIGAASGGDLFIVAVLGLLGGALSATVFVRGLYTNSTPYNVAIPLALLKLPAGAAVAILGMILLAGNFVPNFSTVDEPIKILAYAVLLGFSQQLFTQMVDHRAARLIANVPSKAREEHRPSATGRQELFP